MELITGLNLCHEAATRKYIDPESQFIHSMIKVHTRGHDAGN